MPFGRRNSLSTFQRVMEQILVGLRFVRVYLDDLMIIWKTVDEDMKLLAVVVHRPCSWFEVEYQQI